MMQKHSIIKLLAVLLVLGLLIQPIEAFARDHHHGGGHYHYRGDRWYRSDWFWFDVGLAALAIGALVDALPPGHTTVVVGGLPYYYYNNIYYRPYYPSGYIVVPAPAAPAVVVPAPPQRGETVVINVPNRDGTYTPVTLVRWGDGYVGPQGEYYAGHPTVEQLRVLYGR